MEKIPETLWVETKEPVGEGQRTGLERRGGRSHRPFSLRRSRGPGRHPTHALTAALWLGAQSSRERADARDQLSPGATGAFLGAPRTAPRPLRVSWPRSSGLSRGGKMDLSHTRAFTPRVTGTRGTYRLGTVGL